MNSEQLRSVLASRPLINPQWRVYAGNDEVLNDDLSVPFIHAINTSQATFLALDNSISAQSEIYRVSVASGSVPSSNEQWALSFDRGTTKNPVKLLKIEPKRQQSDYLIYLQKI